MPTATSAAPASRSNTSPAIRAWRRLVALGAPSRPHVFFAWANERSPWASAADIRAKGGVIVWPIADASNAPPPALKALFPEMVPEVPRSFARPMQGLLPLIRLGWAVIRPQSRP